MKRLGFTVGILQDRLETFELRTFIYYHPESGKPVHFQMRPSLSLTESGAMPSDIAYRLDRVLNFDPKSEPFFKRSRGRCHAHQQLQERI